MDLVARRKKHTEEFKSAAAEYAFNNGIGKALKNPKYAEIHPKTLGTWTRSFKGHKPLVDRRGGTVTTLSS